MTIIAACKDNDGSIWMGADTVSARNQAARVSDAPKILRVGEMLIGSSGLLRAHQVVEHLIDCPAILLDSDPREWVIKEFVQLLRSAMKEYGGECKSNERDYEMDARLIVSLRGSLFEIDSGYGVFSPRVPYHAVGCADQEALAAMFTALALMPKMHARAVVQCGLDAAAALDLNIRPPFEILCSEERAINLAA